MRTSTPRSEIALRSSSASTSDCTAGSTYTVSSRSACAASSRASWAAAAGAAVEQEGEAQEKRAHYPLNSPRSRSRSSVSFFSSRGWMTGTSIRAERPLGLASIDCVSRVPAPAASSA